MANGFQGPVDAKTMLGMQGAMEQERGFARAWSAGSSPAVQAAYQQSAANKGAMAANNIRVRYYKKEWEQIQETRIKPLTDQLFEAEKMYRQATASTTMPVPRMVSPEEMQGRSEALQPGQPGITTVPGKPTKEGTQNQEAVETPAPPAPNPALGSEVGAIEHEDALALMDPTTGSPVKLASARGIELMNKASYDFWEQHKRVNIEMMDALSEYAGNPYAAQAQDNMMQNLQTRAGQGATGNLDPQKQQEWMEGRAQFEVQQDQAEQNLEKGAFDLRQGEARMEAQLADALSQAADPKNAGAFKPSTLKKIQNGQALTAKEKAEVAASGTMIRDLQEKQIVAANRGDYGFQISPGVVNLPGNWKAELQQDTGYRQEYTRIIAESQNEMMAAISGMDDQGIQDTFAAAGAPQRVIDTALAGLWNDANVTQWVNILAQDPEIERNANDSAFLLTLPRIERQQPALTPVIDNVIDVALQDMDAIAASRDMPPLTADEKDAIRTDRYQTFFRAQYGSEPPDIHDIGTKRALRAHGVRSGQRQERQRQSSSLIPGRPQGPYLTQEQEYERAVEAEQAEYQRAVEAEAVPAGVKDPSIQPPTEASSPTIGEPAQVSEAMRVYGFENPVTALMKGIRTSLEPREFPGRQRSLSYDVQGRALGMDGKLIESTNPYVNMSPTALQQLSETLPPDSQAYELIVEALAAQNG